MKGVRGALNAFLSENVDASLPFRLVQLYRNWEQVMGEDVAALARPIGRHKNILLVGVEDSAAQQEVTYLAPFMIENAHYFLGEKVFDKVQAKLLMGQVPLDALQAGSGRSAPDAPPDTMPPRPRVLGELRQEARMQGDSAIARCYRAYVRLFEKDYGQPSE